MVGNCLRQGKGEHSVVAISVVLVFALLWSAFAIADGFYGYGSLDVPGWDVRIERELQRRNFIVAERVEAEVVRQLAAIEAGVLPERLSDMQAVTIWISYDNEPGLAYHDSAEFLAEAGRDARMLGGIEIEDARDFLAMSQIQPWLLMHEFAHALHHQKHAWRHPDVDQAWLNAKHSGLYRDVTHRFDGPPRDAYALTNPREYFAELSQTLLGGNAMYPFERNELREYDPVGYQVVRDFWCQPMPGEHSGKTVPACEPPAKQVELRQ